MTCVTNQSYTYSDYLYKCMYVHNVFINVTHLMNMLQILHGYFRQGFVMIQKWANIKLIVVIITNSASSLLKNDILSVYLQ